MVVHQSSFALDSSNKAVINGVTPVSTPATAITTMPIKSNVNEANRTQAKSTHSMSRKYVSMSPSRPVPRSKSMNGISRIGANKSSENGMSTATNGKHHSTRMMRQREIHSTENLNQSSHNTG